MEWLPLLLLQAQLPYGNTKHLMAVETLFLKGAIFDMPDASQSKLLYRWQRQKLNKVDL